MRFLILFATFAAILSAEDGRSSAWPEVRPSKHVWVIPDVGFADQDTPVIAILDDVSGTPIYKLECHNGNYSDQSEMNFSGTFQCALFAINNGKKTSWNLLAAKDEQDSDWANRGRMIAEQLQGECGKRPEFGTRRTFRLREMVVEFAYKDLQWIGAGSDRRLGSFSFEVQVKQDPTARAHEAELIRVPKPPKSCLW